MSWVITGVGGALGSEILGGGGLRRNRLELGAQHLLPEGDRRRCHDDIGNWTNEGRPQGRGRARRFDALAAAVLVGLGQIVRFFGLNLALVLYQHDVEGADELAGPLVGDESDPEDHDGVGGDGDKERESQPIGGFYGRRGRDGMHSDGTQTENPSNYSSKRPGCAGAMTDHFPNSASMASISCAPTSSP